MQYVQDRDRPLAFYWFGEDKAKRDHVLKNTISGGVSINETAWHVVQEDIPFGGVGPSGMGGYHGEHGFETFSHMKGVFFQSKFSGGKMLYPPYTEKTQKVLNMMKKIYVISLKGLYMKISSHLLLGILSVQRCLVWALANLQIQKRNANS